METTIADKHVPAVHKLLRRAVNTLNSEDFIVNEYRIFESDNYSTVEIGLKLSKTQSLTLEFKDTGNFGAAPRKVSPSLAEGVADPMEAVGV